MDRIEDSDRPSGINSASFTTFCGAWSATSWKASSRALFRSVPGGSPPANSTAAAGSVSIQWPRGWPRKLALPSPKGRDAAYAIADLGSCRDHGKPMLPEAFCRSGPSGISRT